ncbi:MAG: glycosyltransferase family 2 protein [Candidatus Abyssubacteria bacterium]
MLSKLKKTLALSRAEGIIVTTRFCASYLEHKLLGTRLLSIDDICYQRWRRWHVPSAEDLEAMRAEAALFRYRPLISVIMPVFNTEPRVLRLAVESVQRQTYANWELCIADDCSTRADTRATLDMLASKDNKITVIPLSEHRGIAGASNAAIERAGGEFIALLDHDDELAPHALFEVVKLLNEYGDTDMIYSDEDKLDENGRHVEAFFKPDWSPELMLSTMYTCHFGVYRKALVNEIGGFRPGFEGAQDYDLVLRLTERTDRIRHIPKILYHWRRGESSTAADYSVSDTGKMPRESSIKALRDTLERRGIEGAVEPGLFEGSYRVRPRISEAPLVTIIIPTRDNLRYLRQAVRSVYENDYRNFELIVVNNRSEQKETLDFLESLKSQDNVQILDFPKPYTFSEINNLGALHAHGNYLLLLNSDTEAVRNDWLIAMLEAAQLPGVGIVGSKLLYPNDTVQHAGVVLWRCGPAGHLHTCLPHDRHGHFGIVSMIRNCSAVTAACMLIRKSVYDELGGLDLDLPVAYQEVDFCLRAWERGYRTVYTPYSLLYHHESVVTGRRVDTRDEATFRRKWQHRIPSDPFYNPNFPPDRLDCRLRPDWPPRQAGR